MGSTRQVRRAVAALVVGTLALPLAPLGTDAASAGPPSPTEPGSTTVVSLEDHPSGTHLFEVVGQDGILTASFGALRRYRTDGSLTADLGAEGVSFIDLATTDAGDVAYALTGDGILAALDGDTLEPLVAVEVPAPPSCVQAMELAGGRLWLAGVTCMGGILSIDLELAEDFVLAGPDPVHVGQRTAIASAGQDADELVVRGGDFGLQLRRLAVHGTDLEVVATRDLELAPAAPLREGAFAVAPDHSTIVSGTAVLDGADLSTLRTLHAVDPGPMTYARGGRHLFGATTFGGTGTWSVDFATPAHWSATDLDVDAVGVSADGDAGYALADDQLVIVRFGTERARLALAAPESPGDGIVRGRLQLTDGTAPAGQLVTVERVGVLGATPVGVVATDATGRFSVPDPLTGEDPPTYRARWLGDLRHPEGALAILPRSAGARTPVAPPAVRIPVQDVPLRQLQPEQVVVDEARQRLLVRGVTKDALGYVTSRRVDVYTYQGVFLQELVLDAPADHLLLTPDQAHLLVVQEAQDRIVVLDATTLLRVGAIATDPGLDSPGQVDLVGTDLVIGHSQVRVAVPLADPTAVRRIGSFDFFDSEQIVADVARPGTAYVRLTAFGSLSAYDLRTTPPTRLAGAEASGGWFARDPLVPNGDGPIRIVEGSIVEHDRETMVRVPGWRDLAQGPRDDWGVKGAAAGPAPELLLTLSGFDSVRSAVIGPIPVIVDGVLEVWDDAATPFRTIDILHVPEKLGATASGSHAFVIAGRHIDSETGDRTGRHWLTTVVDPYARCSVHLDALPASVRTGQAVPVQGRVEVPSGTAHPPHVLVSVGTVHVQAAVGGDGRFSTSITPASPTATAIEAAVPQDVLGGCHTAAAVQVLDGFLAPFESAAGLVDRQTQDLLAGIAPADARAWLIDQVATRAISPGALVTWLAAMSDPVHGALARLHLGALGRWPTSAELQAKVTAMQQGRTLAQVAADLQATKEFTRRFGQPDDGAFVTALYRTLLGRDPTATERRTRLAALARGGTRGQALLAVTQSTTYVRRVAPFVEVELIHLGMLRRNPTGDEAWSWLVDRSRGVPAADLVDQIRFGAAYGERIRGLP